MLLLSLGTKEGMDIGEFLQQELKKLDKNNDQKVDFDEFVECYNSLMDLI